MNKLFAKIASFFKKSQDVQVEAADYHLPAIPIDKNLMPQLKQ